LRAPGATAHLREQLRMKSDRAVLQHGVLTAHAVSLRGDGIPGKPVGAPVKEAVLRKWIATAKEPILEVSGNSMLPALMDGDTVVVKPCGGRVQTGDIVVFFMQEVLLIHRVVRITPAPAGRGFRTKGDFALRFDPIELKEEDALGKAVALRRGKITLDLQSPFLRALGRALAAVSFLAGHFLGRIR
jgi:hypothetical protein